MRKAPLDRFHNGSVDRDDTTTNEFSDAKSKQLFKLAFLDVLYTFQQHRPRCVACGFHDHATRRALLEHVGHVQLDGLPFELIPDSMHRLHSKSRRHKTHLRKIQDLTDDDGKRAVRLDGCAGEKGGHIEKNWEFVRPKKTDARQNV